MPAGQGALAWQARRGGRNSTRCPIARPTTQAPARVPLARRPGNTTERARIASAGGGYRGLPRGANQRRLRHALSAYRGSMDAASNHGCIPGEAFRRSGLQRSPSAGGTPICPRCGSVEDQEARSRTRCPPAYRGVDRNCGGSSCTRALPTVSNTCRPARSSLARRCPSTQDALRSEGAPRRRGDVR